MKVTYLHFSDYAFLTENGKMSVIGIFDRIGSKAFPTTHAAMFVVGQVSEIAKEDTLTLIIRKGKRELLVNDFVTNLQDLVNPLRTYSFIIGLHNFVFPEAGVYDFMIKSQDEEVGFKNLVLEKPAEGN